MKPKLAMCNIFEDVNELKRFALEHNFSGMDWSFDLDALPKTPAEESKWVSDLAALEPLPVRFHCPFYRIDLGHKDPEEARAAEAVFQRIIRIVSKAGGRYLSIHLGLGHDTTEPFSWDGTIDNLTRLVQFGSHRHVRLCLENLAWGWTSRPHLFEKIVRKSGAGITFDIGHAYACDSVRSHHYAVEDFVTPHPDRIFNAHIYHTEISGKGHIPPAQLKDIEERLSLLRSLGCEWWVIEIREPDSLLHTKAMIEEYLMKLDDSESEMKKF